MAKHIIWFKEIEGKQSVGLSKIAENDTHLQLIKDQMGVDHFNTYFETTTTTDAIFNSLQDGTRSYLSGTKDNPTWDVATRSYKNSFEWWEEVDHITNPIKTFIINNPGHTLNEQLEKWVYYLNGTKGSALGFTYPYTTHSVVSYGKTLLNPPGKDADAVEDIAFSPLQLP